MSDLSEFQPYLESIRAAYAKWWQLYTLTDAAGKQRQAQQGSPPFDFGLIVQTVKKDDRREEEKIERFSVLDGIRKYAQQHVLLVGRPGSGKSTALARLMLEEATTAQARIPVLVELRYWQGSIEQLIRDSFTRHDLPAELLDEALKRSLILFDGVNELPSEEARSQLSAFRRNHPKLPMIFTTRDLSLGGDLGIEKKLEMQPLTEAQMQAFIRSYVPEQAEQMLRQLKDRLRELGQTPLLLWMLCGLFQQTGTIPENLGLVFREFTQGYERFLKEDVRIESDRAWWKPVLQQLAWVMMQGEKPTEFRVAIREEEAVRAIGQFLEGKVPYAEDFARKCLRDLQKHHLIQVGADLEELEFRHQLIQEYYAAEALLEQLPKLDDKRLKREYLNFLKWTEPVALMLALVDEAQAVRAVGLALDVDSMLGARLAGYVKEDYQAKTLNLVTVLEVSKVLKIRLLGEMRSRYAIQDLHAALKDEETLLLALRALERIGSDQAICEIPQAVNGKPSSVQSLAVRILEEVRSEVAIKGLQEIASNANSKIKDKVERALEKLGVRSTDKPLSQNITSRRRAMELSSSMSKRDLLLSAQQDIHPSIHKLIQNQGTHDLESFVKMLEKVNTKEAIAILLSTLNEDDDLYEITFLILGLLGYEEVLPQLITALKSDEEFIRESAVLGLSKIGTPGAIDGVIQALEDEDIYEIAAEILIHLADEVALPGLLKILEKEDSDTDICIRTAKALVKIESDGAIEGLLEALQDQSFDKSWVVADALKAAGKENLVLPELLEKMRSDYSYYDRCQTAISLGYLGEVRAIPMLLSAIDCEEPDICWKVIYVLGRFADYPITASTLQELSEAATPRLIQVILESNFSDSVAEAIEALSKLASPQQLPKFWQHSSSSLSFLRVIGSIQKRLKYYDYKIYQVHLEAQKNDRQTPQNNDLSPTIIQNYPNVIEVKQTIMSNSSKYNFPNAQKVQIFEQVTTYIENNHPTDPEVKTAIADLTLLLSQLQTQYPQVTTESQALTVLDAEFTEIQQFTTHPFVTLRQQLLSPERHLQAIKATLAEVAKHYLEESVWSKAAITYLDKMSETPD
ncbi:HEAT repeat domain-containing protein [Leptolyngbya sp. NIES-2104]|uniref:HEAT repeat domain-containing protein n=1 Tax=Leptolyngbya sp. NIES-2104 TaxID=1552121 RepID=UPI0006EC65C1|nr:HEAT repeat domain-containing protein [Leptolyngbya sp. NIES-2104]GAP99633.1 hypothetical protein NIES2104_61990 [Leptolyngbya sp. NIES-2104]